MKKKIIISAITTGVFASSLLIYGIGNSTRYTPIAHADTISNTAANATSEVTIPNTDDGKAQIQNLMLNSIDYYKKASGTMQYLSTTANYNFVINYQTDLSDNPKSYENDQEIPIDSTDPLESAKAKGLHTETQIYDGNSTAMITSDPKIDGGQANTNAMKVDKITKSQRDELKDSTMKNRVIKMNGENGPNTYIPRVDPTYMGIAKISLFPQDIAMGFLTDTTQWNITGNENIAGINTVVIKGTLDSNYSQRYEAQNFTLNVDPNTGILLQMEVTNSNGEITQLVKTFSIKINENLNDKLFSIPSM